MMISVITPTIRAKEVKQLKKAMALQTFRDFEHIIIEDKKREGSAVIRNRALKKSKGEYIAFIDDDCIPSKDWLKDLYGFMLAHKDIAACSGLVFPPENAGLLAKLNYYKSMSDENTSRILEKDVIEVDHVSCTNSMWKKDILDFLGGFDEKLKRSQDLDVGLRAKGLKMLAFNGAKVIHNYPSTLKETLKKSFIKGTGGAHILKKHPDYFGRRRYIIYSFPAYLLFSILYPPFFLLPLLFCRSGFKIYKKEKSIRLFCLATLLEYIKYHFNLAGIWWGIMHG